jgi:hypothetical protein
MKICVADAEGLDEPLADELAVAVGVQDPLCELEALLVVDGLRVGESVAA